MKRWTERDKGKRKGNRAGRVSWFHDMLADEHTEIQIAVCVEI